VLVTVFGLHCLNIRFQAAAGMRSARWMYQRSASARTRRTSIRRNTPRVRQELRRLPTCRSACSRGRTARASAGGPPGQLAERHRGPLKHGDGGAVLLQEPRRGEPEQAGSDHGNPVRPW
jgi:hypothetical protein